MSMWTVRFSLSRGSLKSQQPSKLLWIFSVRNFIKPNTICTKEAKPHLLPSVYCGLPFPISRFSARPDRPWSPPSLLQNGYRVFPWGKVRPGRAADHSPLPVPRSWKSRAISLPALWATPGLWQDHFTFTLSHLSRHSFYPTVSEILYVPNSIIIVKNSLSNVYLSLTDFQESDRCFTAVCKDLIYWMS